ncbi:hypothetical protein AGMMS49992_16430 [Clostridia bacterium]|nr:hypothetical protein AGMMS49992_16430 [Clostridia bacterium]
MDTYMPAEIAIMNVARLIFSDLASLHYGMFENEDKYNQYGLCISIYLRNKIVLYMSDNIYIDIKRNS